MIWIRRGLLPRPRREADAEVQHEDQRDQHEDACPCQRLPRRVRAVAKVQVDLRRDRRERIGGIAFQPRDEAGGEDCGGGGV